MSKKLTLDQRAYIVKDEARLLYDKKLKDQKDKICELVEKKFYKENKFPIIDEDLIVKGYVNTSLSVTLEIPKEIGTVIQSKYDHPFYSSSGYKDKLSVTIEKPFPLSKFSYPVIKCDVKLDNAVREYVKIIEDREKFKDKLKLVLNSISTYKQARETLPEIAHRFKEEEKSFLPIAITEINKVREQLRVR